jgi:hypothetical protein
MSETKNYKEKMFQYFYAPMIGVWLTVAVVAGFATGFDEIFRYWRVVGLNLL